MSFDTTARQWVAPKAEKHEMPACLPLVSFTGYERAIMTKNEWLDFWQNMRENELMLIDAPSRKIAVFANESGQIVLATSEDAGQCITTICSDEIGDFEELLSRAKSAAFEIDAARHADFAIWRAKEGDQ